MKNGSRKLVYDEALGIEAYRLKGVARPFPSHFHEHYVLGFVEKGERILTCRNREYPIAKGCLLLFNPGDHHACVQNDGGTLDYRGFNVPQAIMLDLAEKATGKRELPRFSSSVILDEESACLFRPLHEAMMKGGSGQEVLNLLISRLISQYGRSSRSLEPNAPDGWEEVEKACAFLEQHHARRVGLDEVCRHTGLSRSTLLRAFIRAKGVTPYRYLMAFRVARAKHLLEQGIPPAEAALMTGFSDQSHFTNCFTRLTGLAPGIYREIFSGRESGTTVHRR